MAQSTFLSAEGRSRTAWQHEGSWGFLLQSSPGDHRDFGGTQSGFQHPCLCFLPFSMGAGSEAGPCRVTVAHGGASRVR